MCQEAFQGLTLHSHEYKSASEWAGKHGIVVGTANTGEKSNANPQDRAKNSAHDVAEDMVRENLASVTMIQRSKTCMCYALVLYSRTRTNKVG